MASLMMVVSRLSSGPDTPAATADYWSYWPTVATRLLGVVGSRLQAYRKCFYRFCINQHSTMVNGGRVNNKARRNFAR